MIEVLDSGKIELTNHIADSLGRVGELMNAYANVPMDFADACLVCMSERTRGAVFTLDSDFRIYRKNQGEAIELIIP